MLIYPRAEHRPLGPQTEPRMTGHDVVCLHTDGRLPHLHGPVLPVRQRVGYAGTESHIGTGRRRRWRPGLHTGLEPSAAEARPQRQADDPPRQPTHRVRDWRPRCASARSRRSSRWDAGCSARRSPPGCSCASAWPAHNRRAHPVPADHAVGQGGRAVEDQQPDPRRPRPLLLGRQRPRLTHRHPRAFRRRAPTSRSRATRARPTSVASPTAVACTAGSAPGRSSSGGST
jgi:hypothetical protein